MPKLQYLNVRYFEQSGTFKNEFIKLGIPAEDYDIQNNFNQTDHVIDLFGEIEKEYDIHRIREICYFSVNLYIL